MYYVCGTKMSNWEDWNRLWDSDGVIELIRPRAKWCSAF